MAKDGQNIPVTGMTDAHPINVKENQYTLMLNGNIMTDISSPVTLTNENSNFLCNNLPAGFVVIGTLYAHEDKVVYLWLVNPNTNASQIGYLSEYQFTDANDPFINNPCNECVDKKGETTPLENITQAQICGYTPIVTDGPCCTLGFNIDFPIRRGVFKKDSCGDSIYFTDFRNPPRVLKLQPVTHLPDDSQRCVVPPIIDCEPIPYDGDPTHVDCLSLQIFPTVGHIHVTPEVVGAGGNLQAGVYQMAACYADRNGQRATRTFVVSNPASIFDINQTITDQVNYPTDKAVRFLLSNLDNTEYQYIDLFVVGTVAGVSTVRQYNTIDITSLINDTLEFTLSDFEKGKVATIDDIMQVFDVYELAQEITTAGNTLLLGNLTGPKDLNIQEAVVYMSPFLQWKTYETTEELYADGAAAGDFRTFLRDEVYPLGIVFERNNTLDTCVYPFVGRALNSVVTNAGTTAGYVYLGYWVANGPSVGIYPDKTVITYGGNTYVNSSGGPTASTDVPGVAIAWTLITSGNAAGFYIQLDDTTVSNDDAFQFPGCAPDPTYNLYWKVYNTAYNRGLTCGYAPVSQQCKQLHDSLACTSLQISLPTIAYTVSTGTFSVGDTVTDVTTGYTGVIQDISTGIIVLKNTTGVFTVGGNITGTGPGTASNISYTAGTSTVLPLDCYPNLADISGAYACTNNYDVIYSDASISPPPKTCTDNTIPSPNNICHADWVRSAAYAAGAGTAHPLCIDDSLATYNALYNTGSSALGQPYAVLTGKTLVQLYPGGTNVYGKYNVTNLINGIIRISDPTDQLPPPSYNCLTGVTGSPPTWLWKGVTLPPTPPFNNYISSGSVGILTFPDNTCSTTVMPTMFFMGESLTAPGAYGDCNPADFTGDYWGTGGFNSTQFNSTLYQSYWFSFTASSSNPVVIKVGLFDKFNTPMGAGDYRIDVYAVSPTGAPTYSTGEVTATFYYNVTDVDAGVLLIGDPANSTGNTTSAGQVPLITGQAYYVHVYLLPAGRAKLNVAPVANTTAHTATDTCPCYLPNYAWASICINSPAADDGTVTLTLPAEYQLQCNYDIYYRQNQTPEAAGCSVAPFEFGDFAYWESTKLYPNSLNQNSRPLWGPVCNQPIRHFKFPDCLVTYLHDQDPTIIGAIGAITDYPYNAGRTANIYPVGIKINTEDVKAWLLWAVTEGLITDTERLSITGYKIVRGNRATNKSIVAKGILTDMWKYNEYNWVNNSTSVYNTYFNNYPFNQIRNEDNTGPANDPYLNVNGLPMQAPNQGLSNSRFAFHSPDTSFNAPTIGQELKLEAGVFGAAFGNFYEVLDHPKYTLLSQGGVDLALGLTIAQILVDILEGVAEITQNLVVGVVDNVGVAAAIAIATVADVSAAIIHGFSYLYQWEQLIINFGVPQNFAYYYEAVGNYHSSGILGNIPNSGNKRRYIQDGTYLIGGTVTLNELGNLSKINNYEREDSVYLNLGNFSLSYSGPIVDAALKDTSKFIMSGSPTYTRLGNAPQPDTSCNLTDRKSQVASNYASIKYYLPDQYGSLQDIEWLYTGVFEPIENGTNQDSSVCEVMLGGDEFIVRMSKYIKLPFFLDNPVGTLTGVDWQYQHLSNITNATYFFNSVGENVLNASAIQLKPVEFNFDTCNVSGHNRTMYIGGAMYLFSYGVMSFLCESDFNLNFRRCINTTTTRGFYPYQSDIQNVTQEYLVPITTPNSYLINRDYSKQNKENFFCSQPTVYHNEACVTTYRNRVINSIPDTDPDFFRDNWKIFLGADYFDFPLSHGYLNGLYGIERDRILVLLSDTVLVFNAFYTIDTNAGTAQIGTTSLFAQKPEQEIQADIGYGGTEHHAFVSTPMGHFWVDTERHKVFVLPPQKKSPYAENNPVAISESYDTFFITNLPFFILQDFPTFNTDNNYKDIGITMEWDYRFNRLFLTKLDYQLLPQWKGQVTYVDDGSGRGGSFFIGELEISLTDTNYFCNKSWTISYSPALKTWISFHSFVPNYYIGHAKYFQTGVNFVRPGADQLGVWNHLISNKSYQVYYGTLYPFVTDVIIQEQLFNKQLHALEYQADFLRFQNDYDYYYNPDHTFNKMVIWTENQNSGDLTLVPQAPNDLSQSIRYPIVGPTSTTIMVSRKSHNWRVNQFNDLVANKHNNVPPMILGCAPYMKTVNPQAINYAKPTFQRQHIYSDYINLRFNNDKYSNYKIINKWFLNNTIKTYS